MIVGSWSCFRSMGVIAVVTMLLGGVTSLACAKNPSESVSISPAESASVGQAVEQSRKPNQDELEAVLKELPPSSLIARGGSGDMRLDHQPWK